MPTVVQQIQLAKERELASTTELIEDMSRDYRFHPLFGVAMLKVSFELRPGNWPGFDKILKNTLRSMQADEQELDDFVRQHRSSLEQRCKEVGI